MITDVKHFEFNHFQMDTTSWGVVSAAVERLRFKANVGALGYLKFDPGD